MRFGVDEAGKGPVLGSMFAAAVVADPDALPTGIADSKQLTPARREELAATLEATPEIRIGVAEIPVDRIDDPHTNMNQLTVAAQAEALTVVTKERLSEREASGLAGLVDAGDTDAGRFGRRVADRVPTDLSLDAAHGADETDPLVGAASVIAKVRRDDHVDSLADEYGREIGSGYPSDPTTRAFLDAWVAESGELPDCARRSWKTSRQVLAAADQAGLGDF